MGQRTSVVLLNMGGPDTEEAVAPFLRNLFSDPAILGFPAAGLVRPVLARVIAARRAPKVMGNYRIIGGKSPIRDITEAQASALEEDLGGRDAGFAVHVAMRYWHPRAAAAVEEMRTWDPDRLVVLPLYPHYCSATTGSSLLDLESALRAAGLHGLSRVTVREYPDYGPYLDAMSETVREALADLPDATVLFSAHGLPQKVVDRGDPYLDHIRKTVAGITERLPPVACRLAFQSRVGPVKWLEPSLQQMLQTLAGEGVRSLVVVPISFVSDHIETLHELDVEFRAEAAKQGIRQYRRAAALNTRPAFIRALGDRVRLALASLES